jgi:hypothetical protein
MEKTGEDDNEMLSGDNIVLAASGVPHAVKVSD